MAPVTLKVVLLGSAAAGKTSIVDRYLHGRFATGSTNSTVGAAFGAKQISLSSGKEVVCGIWDTAGQERYEAMARIYYRGAQCAVVCYDLTDAESFTRCRFWVDELLENEPNCMVFLCGTKHDLISEGVMPQRIDEGMVQDYLKEINGKGFVTSSKTGLNIENLFLEIAEDVQRAKIKRRTSKTENHRIILDKEELEADKCC